MATLPESILFVQSLAKHRAAIEIQFNSVEMELARRWAMAEVPTAFVKRPAHDLRQMVKAWWQLYHESVAADQGHNRTVWERNPAYPAKALDTAELVKALQQIEQRINLNAIVQFRPIHQAEHSAIGILRIITAFYNSLPH